MIDFGTTASAVGLVRPGPPMEVELLTVGNDGTSSEFAPADLAINTQNDEVMAVGDAAYLHLLNGATGIRYHTSLKRLVESAVRLATPAVLGQVKPILARNVTEFLVQSFEKSFDAWVSRGNELGETATKVFTIPNSFGGDAFEVISEGVLGFLENLLARQAQQRPGEPPPAPLLNRATVKYLPEGEAVGYFLENWRHLDKNLRPAWARVPGAVKGEPVPDEGEGPTLPAAGRRMAVIDVGGGTVDVTISELESPHAWAVVVNTGIPLAGTDVDRILAGAVSASGALSAQDFWSGCTSEDRGVAAKLLRDLAGMKVANHLEAFLPGQFPLTPNKAFSDSVFVLREALNTVSTVASSAPSFSAANLSLTPGAFAAHVAAHLNSLLDLAIDGPLDAIDQADWKSVECVFVSGRGSLDGPIRERIVQALSQKGMPDAAAIWTIDRADSRLLKLSVLLGAALAGPNVHDLDESPDRLGRRVEIQPPPLGGGMLSSAELRARTPVSTSFATLWEVRLLRPEHNTCAYDLIDALLGRQAVGALHALGLRRAVSSRFLGTHADTYAEEIFVLDPRTLRHRFPRHLAPAGASVRWNRPNPVTGLPVGFPDQLGGP